MARSAEAAKASEPCSSNPKRETRNVLYRGNYGWIGFEANGKSRWRARRFNDRWANKTLLDRRSAYRATVHRVVRTRRNGSSVFLLTDKGGLGWQQTSVDRRLLGC